MQVTRDLLVLPKWLRSLEKPIVSFQKVALAFETVHEYLNSQSLIQSRGACWIHAARFLPLMSSLFSIPRLINSLHALRKSTNLAEKVAHVANSIIQLTNIASASVLAVGGLMEFGVIAKEVFKNFVPFTAVCVPLYLISSELDLVDHIKTIRVAAEFFASTKEPTQACEYLEKYEEDVRQAARLSKKSHLYIHLRTLLQKGASSKECLDTVKARIKTHLAFSCILTVVKIAALITCGLLLLFAVPPLASICLMAGIGITTIALTVAQNHLLKISAGPLGGSAKDN